MENFYKRLTMVFTIAVLISFIVFSQTTINIKVVDIGDDIEEYRDASDASPVGYMDHGSSDLELTTEAANRRQMVGIIWRNVQIPAGATITNAYVQFTCDDDDNQEGPLPISIWGIKEVNTLAPFTDVLFNCTSRPNTTATVTWNCPVWAVKEARTANERTSDIKTIIQEIIGQAGWASGNNLGIKLSNEELGNIHREAEAKDEGAGGEPELFVTYTMATGIDIISAESSVLVYPNPAEGKVTIKNPSSGNFAYAIYTISGNLVLSADDNSGSIIEVDMSGFTKGTYLVDVRAAGKTVKQKLILK